MRNGSSSDSMYRSSNQIDNIDSHAFTVNNPVLVAQQYITVHESSSLATHGNASSSLEQVHRPPPRRDDTDDLTPEGEQIAPLGGNEIRGTRGKFCIATQQFFEIIRG